MNLASNQLGLFEQNSNEINLSVPQAQLRFIPSFFEPEKANDLFERLHREIPFEEEILFLKGKEHMVPRLVSWHGDCGKSYRYSGITKHPKPWNPTLLEVKVTTG